jgi:hypothetical protein
VNFPNAAWLKPRAAAAVLGVALTLAIGFWGLGWRTASDAQQMANAQSRVAVVSALVPLCVAKAEKDPDAARLVRLRGETTTFARTEIVRDSGWATLANATSGPNYPLAVACSDKLKSL